jgi:sugar lactone lactonase YvrE
MWIAKAVVGMGMLFIGACSESSPTPAGPTAGAAGSTTSAGGAGGAGAADAGTDGAGTGGASGTSDAGAVKDFGARVVNIDPARFFPEGVTVDRQGNFYLGSMDMGVIYKATADGKTAAPFIAADAGGLVSVLGLYADDASKTLWVCNSDADNAERKGTAPVSLKSFHLETGALLQTYAWPAPTTAPIAGAKANGFCNDITVDADSTVYATDSWYPRILRLRKGGTALEEWVSNPVFGADQWHLNGIDVDQATNDLYVVENHPGHLWRIPIGADGAAGSITEIATSMPLGGPDGLKVLAPNLLATAESGGVSVIALSGAAGTVTRVASGLSGYATLALHQASAWVVENQGDHFWDPVKSGKDARPPFRLVEIPLNVGAGAGTITIDKERFFPEGTTVDSSGTFYVGSMDQGLIYKAGAASKTAVPFITPDATNKLVSVLGLYAHDASSTLWVCSSDAGNSQRKGTAPVALKSFDLATGALKGSWDWPMPTTTPVAGATVNGFCNDITVDSAGNVYATDSWYPRILRLPAGATSTTMLAEWVTSPIFDATQWHLNGLDVDPAGANLYAVENHPGHLYRIAITSGGAAGMVTEIKTSKPLRGPDGLKVINATTLAVAEGDTGGMALIELTGDGGKVRTVNTGLDGVATFALRGGSSWLVENQGDHFWNPTGPNGPNANKPFRLVEVPLGL